MGLECTNCGWTQPEDASRCPKCGTRARRQSGFGAISPGGPPPASPSATIATGASTQAPKRFLPLAMVLVVTSAGAGIYLASRNDGPRLSEGTVQQGRVTGVSGAGPVSTGEACTLRVEPASGRPYNCRIVVQCGSVVLYGARKNNGYANCVVDGGVPLRADESVPNDSDPDLHYDLVAGKATVKEPNWQVDIETEVAAAPQ